MTPYKGQHELFPRRYYNSVTNNIMGQWINAWPKQLINQNKTKHFDCAYVKANI